MVMTSPASVIGQGAEPWGRWKHTANDIQIDLFLADDIITRDLRCEVGEGFLCAWQDSNYDTFYEDGVWGGEGVIEVDTGAPLLFGRLAQVVLGHELDWDVESCDGKQALRIRLPKAQEAISSLSEEAVCEQIFDQTLHLSGEQLLLPGLSLPLDVSVGTA